MVKNKVTIERLPYKEEIQKNLGDHNNYEEDSKLRWNHLMKLKRISQNDAKEKLFVGNIFQEYEMTGHDVYFHIQGIRKVMDLIEGHLEELSKQNINPEFYTFDIETARIIGNAYSQYFYYVNFLKNTD